MPTAPGAPGRGRSGALLVLILLAFVALGLPEGALGVTFPALRVTFGVPLSALGLLLVPYTGGYMAATLTHGRFVAPFGPPRALMAAALAAAVGGLIFAGGPTFGVLMAGSLLLGASAGTVDATLNAYVSVHFEHRVLAFMHAGFGVGATLGPLAVTALLQAGYEWRVAYALLAAVQLALGVGWYLVRHRFATLPEVAPDATHELVSLEGDFAEADLADPVARTASGRPGLLPLQMTSFFLYTGTEASTGFLIATLLTWRGLDAATAGLYTTVYWASLTVGRVLTGILGNRLPPARALSLSVVGAMVGLVLVAVGGTTPAAGAGVVVVGLSLAPFFPSLVSLTPRRLGAARTVRVMGYQLAAASFGVAVVPAVIGVIADRTSPAVIAPCLLVAASALAVAHLATALLAGDLRTPPRGTAAQPA